MGVRIRGKSNFSFGTIPQSKFENFDTSLYTREALLRFTQTRRATSSMPRVRGEVTLPKKGHKDSFVDPIVAVAPRFCIGSLRLSVMMRSKVQGSLSKTSLRSG